MNRRGFLGSILALGAAPAIVRADSLMRIVPVSTRIAHGGYSTAILNEMWLAHIEGDPVADYIYFRKWIPEFAGALGAVLEERVSILNALTPIELPRQRTTLATLQRELERHVRDESFFSKHFR